MNNINLFLILIVLFYIAVAAVGIYLVVLVIKALRKYISSKEVREEKQIVIKSLSEALKENRMRLKMTQ